jgi:exosortase
MENPVRRQNDRAIGLFFLIVLATSIIGWRALFQVGELSVGDERYSHLLFIPVASICIIVWKRDLFLAQVLPSLGWGGSLLLVGLLGYAVVSFSDPLLHREGSLSLAVASLALMWVATFILCFGLQASRAAVFPLMFLVFMIPAPAFLLSKAILGLQEGSATMTGILFHLLRVPASRNGLIFSLPGVDIEIAEQCSGIRSSLSLFITGVLASYLLLQSTWKRMLLSLITIPVAIFKNGIRIVVLSWLGVYVNPGFLHGKLHQYGGLPVSLLALAILAPIVLALRRSEGKFPDRRAQIVGEA